MEYKEGVYAAAKYETPSQSQSHFWPNNFHVFKNIKELNIDAYSSENISVESTLHIIRIAKVR